jgi:uncharacterized SAM-binding protein YcdF (DUF218 family)
MPLSRHKDYPHHDREGMSRWFSRRGLLRRVARLVILTSVVLLGLLIAGFIWFADSIASMAPPEQPKADAIIVLTGGYSRIEQAIDLLDQGAGSRLLISGVNPKTTSSTIRRVTQSSATLFACCVDIGYQALDTIGNANEAATWIHSNRYKSILVVTNNYHMRRSLHELRSASPETEFIAYPVVNADLINTNWFTKPDVLRTITSEYLKFIVAWVRDVTGYGKGSGLRQL